MDEIKKLLRSMQDPEYRDFQCALMPTVQQEKVIGVRIPQLRALAKTLDEDKARAFLQQLPHEYYEENNLHAFLIERIRDFESCADHVERFLPYVDNWATCDSMRPKCFKKHPQELLKRIDRWISSGKTYTVRFGIGMLMAFYLDEHFRPEYPERVAAVESEEYYVNMMIAWYFATALAKQWESTVPYLEEYRLPSWVHNKTIRKAVESCRITQEQKAYLRTLKRSGT